MSTRPHPFRTRIVGMRPEHGLSVTQFGYNVMTIVSILMSSLLILWLKKNLAMIGHPQTFSFPCLSERISLFKLFEIGFLVVFGDLEGLFCAENENFPV